jgi:hypothetical protein
MKILVLGNCQARPLSYLLCNGSGLTSLEPIILHLAKDADISRHAALCAEAEIIVAQATSDNFEPAHLASRRLKEQHGSKVIIWPNIFWAGQTPFLRYVSHKTFGRIDGPLDAYHDLRILQDWYRSRLDLDTPLREISVQDVQTRSLQDLKIKETACDVVVSDLIEAYGTSQRLFFTFNHPTAWLLSKMAERISGRIGLSGCVAVKEDWEPLGRITPPNVVRDLHQQDATFVGVRTGGALNSEVITYDSEALIRYFFEAYDQKTYLLRDLMSIRYTPNF